MGVYLYEEIRPKDSLQVCFLRTQDLVIVYVVCNHQNGGEHNISFRSQQMEIGIHYPSNVVVVIIVVSRMN